MYVTVIVGFHIRAPFGFYLNFMTDYKPVTALCKVFFCTELIDVTLGICAARLGSLLAVKR